MIFVPVQTGDSCWINANAESLPVQSLSVGLSQCFKQRFGARQTKTWSLIVWPRVQALDTHTHTHAHITRWQSLLSCPLLSCGLEIKSEMACNQIEIVAKCNSVLPLCSVHRVCIVQLKAGVDVVRMKTGGLVCVSPYDASSKITVIDLPRKEKQLAEAHLNMGKSLL